MDEPRYRSMGIIVRAFRSGEVVPVMTVACSAGLWTLNASTLKSIAAHNNCKLAKGMTLFEIKMEIVRRWLDIGEEAAMEFLQYRLAKMRENHACSRISTALWTCWTSTTSR